jgi:hypothetical protein
MGVIFEPVKQLFLTSCINSKKTVSTEEDLFFQNQNPHAAVFVSLCVQINSLALSGKTSSMASAAV